VYEDPKDSLGDLL